MIGNVERIVRKNISLYPRDLAIETPGRAYVQLPGRPLTELQAPLVTLADIETALSGQNGPTEVMPVPGHRPAL